MDNQILVIFGASGDLTARKLVPAVYDLFKQGFLPEHFIIIGASRSKLSDEDFRKRVLTESEYIDNSEEAIASFADKLFYESIEGYDADFAALKQR
ncbi:MAG: glucose-6-phosphate dehydrogenase, partial [Bacteroidota bacterium]